LKLAIIREKIEFILIQIFPIGNGDGKDEFDACLTFDNEAGGLPRVRNGVSMPSGGSLRQTTIEGMNQVYITFRVDVENNDISIFAGLIGELNGFTGPINRTGGIGQGDRHTASCVTSYIRSL
jgi:hypothetical protein